MELPHGRACDRDNYNSASIISFICDRTVEGQVRILINYLNIYIYFFFFFV
jgi:hypothetical protein